MSKVKTGLSINDLPSMKEFDQCRRAPSLKVIQHNVYDYVQLDAQTAMKVVARFEICDNDIRGRIDWIEQNIKSPVFITNRRMIHFINRDDAWNFAVKFSLFDQIEIETVNEV